MSKTPASLAVSSPPAGYTASNALSHPDPDSLNTLLERQKQAPLPALYGENPEDDEVKGDRLRAGISEVLAGGSR